MENIDELYKHKIEIQKETTTKKVYGHITVTEGNITISFNNTDYIVPKKEFRAIFEQLFLEGNQTK